jgi:3-keto-5-aminohexanoate cleavage enzyme
LIHRPYYFNLILGNIASAQADLAYVGLAIKDFPEECFWALGGVGINQLKMNTLAIAFGGGVRVGLEDNIWFDINRNQLATNKNLVVRIHQLAEIFERIVMPPEKFGGMGFYNKNKVFD